MTTQESLKVHRSIGAPDGAYVPVHVCRDPAVTIIPMVPAGAGASGIIRGPKGALGRPRGLGKP
jgi:hypothetical protein